MNELSTTISYIRQVVEGQNVPSLVVKAERLESVGFEADLLADTKSPAAKG